VVECNYQAATTKALHQSSHEPTGQPTANRPNPDRLWMSIEPYANQWYESIDNPDTNLAIVEFHPGPRPDTIV
jgi:hypothetical protein